jgi:hypothetical protein
MKRFSNWIACMGVLVALMAPLSGARAADVSVSLRIGDRYRGSDVYFRSEPRVVVVPGTRVYYVQDYDYDMYRYGRFWYMNSGGNWYRSRTYRGPWIYVGYRSVPVQISYVPPRYRRHWRDFRDVQYRNTSNRGRHRGWDDRYDRDRDRDRDNRGWDNR